MAVIKPTKPRRPDRPGLVTWRSYLDVLIENRGLEPISPATARRLYDAGLSAPEAAAKVQAELDS